MVLIDKAKCTGIDLLLLFVLLDFCFKVAIGYGYFGADHTHILQLRPPTTIVPHQESATGLFHLANDFQGNFFLFGTLYRDAVLFGFDEAAKDYVSGMAQHGGSRSENNVVGPRTFDNGNLVGFGAVGRPAHFDNFSQAQPLF